MQTSAVLHFSIFTTYDESGIISHELQRRHLCIPGSTRIQSSWLLQQFIIFCLIPTMEVKSVGTFPLILLKLLKLATPPPLLFFAATTLPGLVGEGEGGGLDDGMNPKPNKKLSLGAESYGTIAWKGFFTKSQVLLSSIVTKWYATGKRLQNACARLIFKERKFSHIKLLLQSYIGYQ